jgi:hypothetical protein
VSGGIDKLILLSNTIEKAFLDLTREEGSARGGYRYVLDFRQIRYKIPVIIYCDGRHSGIHKIEVVGVARMGLRRTRKILKMILGHLSAVRIYRIDLCTDIPGIWVWDLAEIVLVSRSQNFKIYNNRGGVTFYLQNSAHKTILLYDKVKQLTAKGDPLADTFGPGEYLTRVEVQLKGRGVPFKKIRHLHRYADVDVLTGLKLRRLTSSRSHKKPLRAMAAAYLARQIEVFGLHAALKQFPSSHRAYIKKLFLVDVDEGEAPDIRGRMKKSIQDWLEDRIRFPSPLFARASIRHESD